jgi:hydrogenase nickel incorporation protein HypA/HybF
MHEYSLIQALVTRVAEEAQRRKALKVHSLSVRVGELSGVEPELLQGAYEVCRTGTVCELAELRVERVVARWGCPRCGRTIALGEALSCKGCGVPAELSEGGDALTLLSIELEVP